MKNRVRYIYHAGLTLLFILFLSIINAQTNTVVSDTNDTVAHVSKTQKHSSDTTTITDSLSVKYYLGTTDSLREGKLHFIDTTITFFHQYDPLKKNYNMYATLSNIGMASKNRLFTPAKYDGFLMHNLSFLPYLFINKNVKYYKLYVPYTQLWYIMGPKKEQNLEVTFTRQIYKGFIFGMDLLMFNSPGLYLNSKTDDKSVYFTGQYFTHNKRYGIIANYLHNKLILLENGGITNDSIFENNLETDRRVIPVNLSTAKNMIKEAGFFIEQYFNLLKPENQTDSSKRKIDAGHISYTIKYQRNNMIYSDSKPLSEFYSQYSPPLDSSSTFDSTCQILFRNRFKWSSLGYNEDKLSRFFHLYFGIDYDYIENTLPYDSTKVIYNQFITFAGININILKSSYLEAKGEIVAGGYNSGDFELNAKLTQYLGNEFQNIGILKFGLQLINRMPAWYFSKFQSNRFRWNIDLKKENYLIFNAAYQYNNLEAGIHFYTVTNYVYFNDTVFPTQLSKTESVMQVFTKGKLKFRKFGIDGKLVYQATSLSSVFHLPTFTATTNLFFKTPAFHNAAIFQTGFQLSYYTNYFADSYMPELRTFYLQNKKKIGNYVQADAYLTLKIKRARIFVKANNFTGYFEGFKYYNSPNYPAMDPGFYFGVAWKFYN